MDIQAVILAAGYSSRAGAFKMTLDLGGKKILERCIESFYDICSRIYVVGGYRIDKVCRITQKYEKVVLINNHAYDKGMFKSVQAGVMHVTADRFFLTPGDHPMIKKETCLQLAKEEADIVIPHINGRKGHPVLIKGSLAGEILKEPEDFNLKGYIEKKGYKLLAVNDRGIFSEVDTVEDYFSLLKEHVL